MSPPLPSPAGSRPALAPLVLVADEDTQTLELLRTVFAAEHFRVITAANGDEAIRRSLSERPDLVVLEVRLPKRNGFEVCDYLRHDPDDPHVPLMFVATAADPDVRVEALSRGADDFLDKPFAPRELVARARRLLFRAGESKANRRRVGGLEQDLERAQGETRRSMRDLARERRLNDLVLGVGRGLLATLDPDELGERTLALAMRQLDCGAVALLAGEPGHARATAARPVRCFRGESAARFAGLELAARGELATMLEGLGRPVLAHELERWPATRAERAPFAGAGVALLAPLRGQQGLEAVLVADEPLDGAMWSADERDWLRTLCDLSATAHLNARRYRAVLDVTLAEMVARAQEPPRAVQLAAEAWHLAETAAVQLALPARERELLRLAVAFGPWAWGEAGRECLRQLQERDASRHVASLRAMLERAETLELDEALTGEERRASLIAAVCVRHQVGRRSGRSVPESWTTAMAWTGVAVDPDTIRALAAAPGAPSGNGNEHRAA